MAGMDTRCPRCDGSGWVNTGRMSAIVSGGVVYDVALYEFVRCPLRCDAGVYVSAVDIGARADFHLT